MERFFDRSACLHIETSYQVFKVFFCSFYKELKRDEECQIYTIIDKDFSEDWTLYGTRPSFNSCLWLGSQLMVLLITSGLNKGIWCHEQGLTALFKSCKTPDWT